MNISEQKEGEVEGTSDATQEYNREAEVILKNLCNWCNPSEFRQFLMEMYVHTVGSDEYRVMPHAEQLKKAMMLHKLTNFCEMVESWDSGIE
ncbi:MAG: hypothetical protein R2822_08845 [Spirosomataceae bacterium]